MTRFIFRLNYHLPIKLLNMSYYAVAKGRNPGIYSTWAECSAQVHKFSGAAYKKFGTQGEAQEFIKTRGARSASVGMTKTAKAVTSVREYSTKSKPTKRPRSPSPSEDSEDKREFRRFEKERKGFEEGGKYPIAFKEDSEGRVDIYTDGACPSNGFKGARAGYGVFFGDDHPLNVAKPAIGRPTNNNAEIQAVTEAANLSKKHGIKKIRINTDSQFLINCITKWMPAWKRRGWKTVTNKPVINQKELVDMETALTGLDYEFNHVRGHVGIWGNEEADRLARLGAEQYKS